MRETLLASEANPALWPLSIMIFGAPKVKLFTFQGLENHHLGSAPQSSHSKRLSPLRRLDIHPVGNLPNWVWYMPSKHVISSWTNVMGLVPRLNEKMHAFKALPTVVHRKHSLNGTDSFQIPGPCYSWQSLLFLLGMHSVSSLPAHKVCLDGFCFVSVRFLKVFDSKFRVACSWALWSRENNLGFREKWALGSITALLLTLYAVLGKICHFSQPQFSHL